MHTSLMIQGTTSDAGKSTLVAALCRILCRRGVAVAPFKPQNMALNSAVTSQQGEIGRAQALQAQAARIDPHTDMNPVLLKPSSDTRAQVIIHGQIAQDMEAVDYHHYKTRAMTAVMASWQRLKSRYDAVMIEGAGSPAEINLRDRDIANMGFAEAADVPVILIADIDRGGVFAQLTGTLALLSPSEQKRVKGFVINQFRGDMSLLMPGIHWLEQHTSKPVLGVLPYLHGLQLDAEDGIDLAQPESEHALFTVVVPVLPRISNHTDFDPLRAHPQVNLVFVGPDQPIPAADLILIPGSKNVRADTRWLKKTNWPKAIARHLRYGGKVMGICGGYQMLGEVIHDPNGIEDHAGSTVALGLLPVATHLMADKTLRNVSGSLWAGQGRVSGYEIHCGVSRYTAPAKPMIFLDDCRSDGCVSEDGLIAGTYLHGLFDSAAALTALLAWAGLANAQAIDRAALREQAIDRLADCVEQHLDLPTLFPRWWQK